VGNLNSHCP